MNKLAIYFAPLQGFTDAAYRHAHHALCQGVEAYYAPFLRLEHGEIRHRDIRDIEPSDLPLVPQIIAANADELCILTKVLADKGYRHIDLNMGCPFPMQTRLGRGAGLLAYPDRLTEMLDEVKRLHEQGVCFSVKMRLGNESSDEWQSVLPLLNATPLEHITIHPRIGKQQYKGEVDMQAFQRLYEESLHPVICNGDIRSVEDIRHLAERYPRMKGIMIGRGLLARPTLAEEYLLDRTCSDDDVRQRILDIHQQVLTAYEQRLEGGDAQVLQKIQPFWEYAGALFDHRFLKQLKKCHNLKEYKNQL